MLYELELGCRTLHDCGHLDHEIEHALSGRHTLQSIALGDLTLILCDFCWIDFDSYYPELLRLPKGSKMKPRWISFERWMSNIGKDKYCPTFRPFSVPKVCGAGRQLHHHA